MKKGLIVLKSSTNVPLLIITVTRWKRQGMLYNFKSVLLSNFKVS